MHGIPSGPAGDLGTFIRALNDDKLLAMNFWSLVVRISDQENGSNKALLEAIAEGVTGRSVAETEAAGGEQRWLMEQMAAMLAGEDVRIPAALVPSTSPALAAVAGEISLVAVEAPVLVLTPPPADLQVSAETRLQPFLIRDEDERSRLMSEPEVGSSKSLLGQRVLFGPQMQEESVRAFRVPLEGYAASSASGSGRMIAFAVLMVVALGCGAFFARGDRAALQQKFGPSVRAGYNSAWREVKDLSGWVSNAAR